MMNDSSSRECKFLEVRKLFMKCKGIHVWYCKEKRKHCDYVSVFFFFLKYKCIYIFFLLVSINEWKNGNSKKLIVPVTRIASVLAAYSRVWGHELIKPSSSSSQRFPVDQRNGDGEAKCPAGRARVCPTVLHTPEPGPRLPAQVWPSKCSLWCSILSLNLYFLVFLSLKFLKQLEQVNLSSVQVLWKELLLCARRPGQQRQTSRGSLWTICKQTSAYGLQQLLKMLFP